MTILLYDPGWYDHKPDRMNGMTTHTHIHTRTHTLYNVRDKYVTEGKLTTPSEAPFVPMMPNCCFRASNVLFQFFVSSCPGTPCGGYYIIYDNKYSSSE